MSPSHPSPPSLLPLLLLRPTGTAPQCCRPTRGSARASAPCTGSPLPPSPRPQPAVAPAPAPALAGEGQTERSAVAVSRCEGRSGSERGRERRTRKREREAGHSDLRQQHRSPIAQLHPDSCLLPRPHLHSLLLPHHLLLCLPVRAWVSAKDCSWGSHGCCLQGCPLASCSRCTVASEARLGRRRDCHSPASRPRSPQKSCFVGSDRLHSLRPLLWLAGGSPTHPLPRVPRERQPQSRWTFPSPTRSTVRRTRHLAFGRCRCYWHCPCRHHRQQHESFCRWTVVWAACHSMSGTPLLAVLEMPTPYPADYCRALLAARWPR